MTMYLLMACALLHTSEAEARPLDAFQANMSGVKVKLDFEFFRGELSWAAVADGSIWAGTDPFFVAKPSSAIVGTWSSDGEAVHYLGGSPEAIRTEGRKRLADQHDSYRRSAHGDRGLRRHGTAWPAAARNRLRSRGGLPAATASSVLNL